MRSRLGPRTPSSFMRNAMPAPSRDRKSLAGRPRRQAGKRKTGPPAPRSPGNAPGWSRYRNNPAVPRPSAPERGPALEPWVPLGQSVVSRTRQKSLLHMVRPTRPGCALGIQICPTCPDSGRARKVSQESAFMLRLFARLRSRVRAAAPNPADHGYCATGQTLLHGEGGVSGSKRPARSRQRLGRATAAPEPPEPPACLPMVRGPACWKRIVLPSILTVREAPSVA